MSLHHLEGIPIPLPAEIVEKSNGFALDIGCSTAKLVYRCKQDYSAGRPLKAELKEGKGRVYIVPNITRELLDDVIALIASRADVIRHNDAPTSITTCGVGCNLFRRRLEEGLNIKLVNMLEFDCFMLSLHHLATNLPPEKFFSPVPEKAVRDSLLEVELMAARFAKMAAAEDEDNKINFNVGELVAAHEALQGAQEAPAEGPPQPQPITYPAIIAMCGSGVGFFKVEADGTWKIVDGVEMGGRSFLGLARLLSGGEKDFGKMLDMMRTADFRSTDEFPADLLNTDTEGDENKADFYSHFASEIDEREKTVEKPALPFGKAVTADLDTIKKEDSLKSLYRIFCNNLAQMGYLNCKIWEAPNMYFCGNLTANPEAQYWIYTTIQLKNMFMGAGGWKPVRVEFIENGGHLGALGAFLKAKEVKST